MLHMFLPFNNTYFYENLFSLNFLVNFCKFYVFFNKGIGLPEWTKVHVIEFVARQILICQFVMDAPLFLRN